MPQIHAYEAEPYRTELEVEVSEVGSGESGPYAIADDTLLYPGGGGQPPDRGRLGDVAVREVRVEDEGVRLILAGPVPPGATTMALDWATRFDHMQQHSAQHLLSAIADDRFGWPTTSFHMTGDVCDVELDVTAPPADALALLEDAAMEVVRQARTVRAWRVPADAYAAMDVRSRGLPSDFRGDVRLVEIEGVDLTTCGGTHLRSTSEIETIALLGAEAMRGGTRLRWVAGSRVRTRLRDHERRTAGLRAALGVADDELVVAASDRVAAAKAAAGRARHLEARLAEETARRLTAAPGEFLPAHLDEAEPAFLQAVARGIAGAGEDRVALLTSDGAGGPFFVLVGSGRFEGIARAVGGEVAAALKGRGGGSGPFFQGRATSLHARQQAVDRILAAMSDAPARS